MFSATGSSKRERPGSYDPGVRIVLGRAQPIPTMNDTLVVPLPPMFRVWKFFAPST